MGTPTTSGSTAQSSRNDKEISDINKRFQTIEQLLELDTRFAGLEIPGQIATLQGQASGLLNGALSLQSETIASAGALSTTLGESLCNNAGGSTFAVTLAAPSNQDGQLKVIKLGTATHTVTLAMTNIKGPGFCTLSGTTTLTFTSTGDCAVLMGVGTKWQLIGGNAVAS